MNIIDNIKVYSDRECSLRSSNLGGGLLLKGVLKSP